MNYNSLLIGLIAFLLPLVLVGGILKLEAEVSFPARLASIEQLREDVRCVDLASSEDVMGQVVQVNRDIRGHQRENDIPFFGFFTADRWDDVEIISVKDNQCTT